MIDAHRSMDRATIAVLSCSCFIFFGSIIAWISLYLLHWGLSFDGFRRYTKNERRKLAEMLQEQRKQKLAYEQFP